MADESREIVLKVTADTKTAQQGLDDTQQALNANQKALQSLNREYKKGSIATDDYTQAVDGLTNENKELLATQKNIDKNQKDQVKSVQDLRNRYKQLRETLNSAKVGVNITAKEFENLKKETFETQEEIRDFDRSISGSNTLVGEYTRGILDAGKQQRIFGVSVGSVTTAVSSSTKAITGTNKALNLFKIALVSTGIGAILVALGSLITFLTKSQKGIDAVNKVTAVLGQLLAELTDVAISFGETLFNVISNPKQAIIDLGNAIVENIQNRIQGIALIGESLVKVFNNVTDPDAWADLGDAVIQTGTGITNATDKVMEFGKTIAETTKEAFEDAERAGQLEDRRQQLARDRVQFIVREAELIQQVAEARAAVENTELSIAERQEANSKAIELTNTLESERIALKNEELDILKTQNSLSESTLEDLQAEKELEAEILTTTAERDKNLKSLLARNKALTAEAEKEQKQIEKNAAAEQKRIDDRVAKEEQAALDLEQFRLEQEIKEEENEKLKAEKEIELEQFKLERLLEVQQLAGDQKILAEEQTQAAIDEIREVAANEQVAREKKEVEIARAAEDAKLNAVSQGLQNAEKLLKEGSAAAKAIQIAQTLVEVYKGAQAAFASQAGIPIVGPALAATQFAASLASGFQTISKITNIKFADGGLTSGGMFTGSSHANGGVKFRVGGQIHEAEGGEAIINKRSTAMFKPLLSAINEQGGGRKFATGGTIPDAISSANAVPDQTQLMENSLRMLPTPIVRVSEINATQSRGDQIVNVSSL